MNNHTEACCDKVPIMPIVHVNSVKSVSAVFSLSMMTAGLVGNGLAFTIIYMSYKEKEHNKKHSFLLFVGALVLTNFIGKLLTSPIVISVYLCGLKWETVDPLGYLCQFFGVCMTMFGLCPLFIASAMAIERTLAVYFPIWYSSSMGGKTTGNVIIGIWVASLGFSLLPLAGVGQYSVQWPGTWSFISIDQENFSTLLFATTFAFLGLLSLATTFVCNLATIKVLVSRCKKFASHTEEGWGRIMTETLIQLLGITFVLVVCWTPTLVNMVRMTFSQVSTKQCMQATSMQSLELQEDCRFFLTTIRLSSINQILDPWVYLLLKWVLSRKCCTVATDV